MGKCLECYCTLVDYIVVMTTKSVQIYVELPFLNSFIKTENVLTYSRLISNQQFYKIQEAIDQPEKEKCI